MKRLKIFKTLPIFSFLILLNGCGGGGTSSITQSDSSSSVSTYSITGTVPGTIIEAYCTDGSYYKTTSIHDDTSEHPFSLELPKDLDCKLVMITNETAAESQWIITPIGFTSSTSSGTYLALNENIDLGYIPLDTVNSTGQMLVKAKLDVNIGNKLLTIRSYSNDPLDNDNDGIPNVYEDDDGDGHINKIDKDEIDQSDRDHDGIADIYDHDDDNDGIKDDDDDDYEDYDESLDNVVNTTVTTLPSSYTVNTGAYLVAQCAGCHGTNGVSSSNFDSIRGEDDLYHEMFDDDPIMTAQAKGYTLSEINAMEQWLNGQ